MPTPMPPPAQPDDPLKEALLRQRTALGILGGALPVLLVVLSLWLGAPDLRSSISMHVWQPNTGALFAGAMTAIGIFLLYYRGYPRSPSDHMMPPFDTMFWRRMTDASLTSVAGIGALGLAMVPVCPDAAAPGLACSTTVHQGATALFFAALTVMALVQFTRSDVPPALQTAGKRLRTRIFVACGLVMALCLVAIVVLSLVPAVRGARILGFGPVFWLEALAVWAFAAAWLVKGEAYRALPEAVLPAALSSR